MPEPTDFLCLDVPCNRHAPAVVRQALDQSPEIGASLNDAKLVASELVTNAVLHSGCTEEHAINVQVSRRSETLLIMVQDPGVSGSGAQLRDAQSFGGWGLQIVNSLARRWGTERTGGYRVWAEVARAG